MDLSLKSLIKKALKDFRKARPGYLAKVTFIDKALSSTLLWVFPNWILPNHLTLFRFLSIPIILFFMISGNVEVSAILFVLAAFSDALDGAMARTRKQITEWGILNDPLADKLLISSVVAVLVSKYISPFFAGLIIFFEVVIAVSALVRAKKTGDKIIPAKLVGKLKMIFESLGLASLFALIIFYWPWVWWVAVVSLITAVFFAFLSLFVYKSI